MSEYNKEELESMADLITDYIYLIKAVMEQ